jgi:16S rRNA G1207 methylase RsmC
VTRSHSSASPQKPSVRRRPAAEQLLLKYAVNMPGKEALCFLLSGTSIARGLIGSLPDTRLHFWTPEHFLFANLVSHLTDHRTADYVPQPTICRTLPESGDYYWSDGHAAASCCADPASDAQDLVLFATSARGSTELTQELLQESHRRLRTGGRLLVTTDNPKDHWLHKQLQTMFGRVTAHRESSGCAYITEKRAPLKKERTFTGAAAFRLGDRLIHVQTRPGVFCHRAIDGGARALIKSITADHAGEIPVPDPLHGAGLRIVEFGCGSGAVALAAAVTWPEAEVLAIDSHARATACTAENAASNDLTNIATRTTSDGTVPDPGTWDLVLANPPYFADFRISELFLKSAKRALRAGGGIRIVTKLTDSHTVRMRELFTEVQVRRFGHYDVLSGTRR